MIARGELPEVSTRNSAQPSVSCLGTVYGAKTEQSSGALGRKQGASVFPEPSRSGIIRVNGSGAIKQTDSLDEA